MKKIYLKISTLVLFSIYLTPHKSISQSGTVIINQDKKITELLDLKKEINKEEELLNIYKIQIYNGDRAGAKEAKEKFDNTFPNWKSKDIYEPPNFKIWIGDFETRLEADRALRDIKRKFRSFVD